MRVMTQAAFFTISTVLDVLGAVRMSFWAMSPLGFLPSHTTRRHNPLPLSVCQLTTTDILKMRNKVEVGRVATASYSTQMVHFKSFGNLSNEQPIDETMSKNRFAIPSDTPVAISGCVPAADPEPTSSPWDRFNLCLKTFWKSVHFK